MVTYRSREYAYQNSAVRGVLIGMAVLAAVLFSVGGRWGSPDGAATAWWLGAIIITGLLLPLSIPLTVTVDGAAVRISLSGVLKAAVHVEDITAAEVRRYRPLKDFGGWGWKESVTRAHTVARTTRGTTAVVLTLHDGSEVYLGVDDEQGLIDALAPRIGANR